MSMPPSSISAIILAAGSSQRFPGANKLLVPIHNTPIIERVTKAISATTANPILVITGEDHQAIHSLLNPYPSITCIQNENWTQGMGTSLAKGIDSIPQDPTTGILICLGDLPYLTSDIVQKLIDTFENQDGQQIIIPQHQGRRGHPIIFPFRYRDQLSQLSGDTGARNLLKRERSNTVEIEVDSSSIFQDIDNPKDLPENPINE